MVPHPDMTMYLVREHQRELLCEAEAERMAAAARPGQSDQSERVRHSLGATLLAAIRSLRPRAATSAPSPAPRTLAPNER